MRALLVLSLLAVGCGVLSPGDMWSISPCGQDWDRFCETRTGTAYVCRNHSWYIADCPDTGCNTLEELPDAGEGPVVCRKDTPGAGIPQP
jgi:hypothetical protein